MKKGALQRTYVRSCNFRKEINFKNYLRKVAFALIFIQAFDNFRVLGHASNFGNFEITEINNRFMCLGGCDHLKVRMLRRRGYLKNMQECTRGRGSQGGRGPKIDKLSARTFEWPPRGKLKTIM